MAAVTIPVLMKELELESFGVLTLIWTLIGYFSLFDLGLGRSITHHVSAKLASNSAAEIAGIIKAGLTFAGLAGLLGGGILLVLANPLSNSWLHVSKAIEQQTYHALVWSAIGIPFVVLSSGVRGVLEAYSQFDRVNITRILQGVTTFAFPVLSVFAFGPDLGTVALWLVISRVLTLVIYVYFLGKAIPQWSSTVGNTVQKSYLLRFGAWMTISNTISPLLIYLDRFVISGMFGAAVVAYYTVPFEVLTKLLILPGALGSALFPRLSREYQADYQETHRLMMRAVIVTTSTMAVLCTLAAAAYFPLVSWWMSQDFAQASWRIASLLAFGVFVNSLGFVFYTAVQAKVGARQTALLHLTELVFFVPVLYALSSLLGLEGAAVAWTVRVSFDALVMWWFYTKGVRHAV